jgi:carbon-monoxide dehydrogenase large subunit/6-hydroxypseudooxynicotine dehydrogenase subunit gamma
MTSQPWIGKSVTRLEDPPLVTGRGRYVGDIFFAHQLHMRIVRSPAAHGRIVLVDTRAAKAMPGVLAIWTAADISDVPPVDFREGRLEKLEPYRQPVLAIDRVGMDERRSGGAASQSSGDQERRRSRRD